MSTQVKVVTRDGKFGLILHQHGNSAWHPANEVHSRFVGRPDRDNDEGSHALHAADAPAVFRQLRSFANDDAPADWLTSEYKACLQGVTQLYWNIQWKAKLAARKERRLAREKGEQVRVPERILTPAGFSDPTILD